MPNPREEMIGRIAANGAFDVSSWAAESMASASFMTLPYRACVSFLSR